MPSQQLVTDITTCMTNGPSVATQALANVASGAIMDYPGNLSILQLNLIECKTLVKNLIADTDAADGNLALLQGILGSLV